MCVFTISLVLPTSVGMIPLSFPVLLAYFPCCYTCLYCLCYYGLEGNDDDTGGNG